MSKRIYPIELEPDERGERWRVNGQQIMAGVHFEKDCLGKCVLHSPTYHNRRQQRLEWDKEFHVFVRVCEHGFRTNDPDDNMKDAAKDWWEAFDLGHCWEC